MHGLTPIQRFMRYVTIPADSKECWGWFGAQRKDGWGTFRIQPGRGGTMNVGRASWLLHRGPIPDGMHVCHRCDNGLCGNPDHLWLGTNADNMRDCSGKGRNIRQNPSASHMTPTKSGTRVHVRIRGVFHGKHFPRGTPHNTMQRWLHETRARATSSATS